MDLSYAGESAYRHVKLHSFLREMIADAQVMSGEDAAGIFLSERADAEARRTFAIGWEIGKILHDDAPAA